MVKKNWIKIVSKEKFIRWGHKNKDQLVIIKYQSIFENWNFSVIRNGMLIRSTMTRTKNQAIKLANNYMKNN